MTRPVLDEPPDGMALRTDAPKLPGAEDILQAEK